MSKDIKELTNRQEDNLRTRIARRSGGYIKLLDLDARGEKSLTQGQRDSIKTLLRKVLPDVTATEITNTSKQIKPEALQRELMELLQANPQVARQLQAIIDKKPELKAVSGS